MSTTALLYAPIATASMYAVLSDKWKYELRDELGSEYAQTAVTYGLC